MTDKVIFIDWFVFVHKAIFAQRIPSAPPSTWNCMNMIISCLTKIGVEPFDTIFIATDYMGSWRKQYEKEYKANRKELRDAQKDVDWKTQFALFDDLLDQIKKGTDWNVLRIESFEADDWMAVGSRYFKDKEVILVTLDSDLQQCWNYNNVKIYSPHPKVKGYKVKPKNFDVNKLISSKIKKEKSDNLINPILNEKDYEKRLLCVDLLNLPDFVETPILNTFKNMKDKSYDERNIRSSSIRAKLEGIYNNKSKVVTYEQFVKKEERKINKKINEKLKKKAKKLEGRKK